ncbi:bifunctional 3-(3-hydroxy-phenyl)propionate/3-hydroxycinnamic acid hydroxylase [Undibacterium sp.]|jgi:3-(3-hydroxy-phenyl)propionate hydroxylase|uniref:bifunctional 3-(3-hydroxy-phenyl)propionate/3-hydroxycinnamic acid hydroxylase n=1 Tax=Undibacterium sp. TaxID=1914977 RepID=UPI002CC94327|nr:bifunctional 3-(3-hydroxy-phenyl)propionate/3-hydroxycinnamic acid hydroxylase [Undibacterium sp.]HTD05829.1 bifunctional 3-(3-hydroxy-phenyl)propionate/3-hydroxycinnamic acid hydroxylase [Undibacterium sp.]
MRQTLSSSVDVLLVGLGPVGATAANLLGRYGVRTLVIEKSPDIFMAPRAIVLDNEALRILQMAGLEEGAFETQAIAKVQMRSPLFGNYARANTAGPLDGHPRLVTFYQPDLERTLRTRLAAYPDVQVALGAELINITENEHGIHVEVRMADGQIQTVQTRFLVGADGASSFVRRHAGLDFQGKTFEQDWLIVDARDVPNPIDHVEFLCDPRRPTPHMPAPGNRQRWEFKLQPGETPEQMEKPESIRKLLAPWCKPEDITIERTAVYRFHARIVDRFSRGRIFLVGDAAHITPPFAGQGLVAGLRDVANLCWKLAWVVHGRASAAILDTYDIERRPHAKSIIKLALFMGSLVMPSNRLKAFGIHGLMWLMQLIPSARAMFEELRMKPKNQFGCGLFVQGRSRSRLMRGGLLPQGLVRQSVGSPVQKSDDAIGQQLTLIGFGCDPIKPLSLQLRGEWLSAGGKFVQLRHRGQSGSGENSWEDMSDAFVPSAAPVGWVAVVRPDRTVLHDGPLEKIDAIVSEALAMFGTTKAAGHFESSVLDVPQ